MKKYRIILLFLVFSILFINIPIMAEEDSTSVWSDSELMSAYNQSEYLASNRSDAIALIDTKLEINKDDSTLHVHQLWSVVNKSGTEWYVPMQELKGQTIKKLKVRAYTSSTDLNMKDFETLGKWNINSSFEDKAYKAGINTSNSYPEICFGKSEMGRIVYYVSYDLTDAVKKSSDGMPFIFQKIINDSMDPAPVKVAMTLNVKDSDSKTKIWAFGFNGNIEPYQDNDFRLRDTTFNSSSSYMTLLVTMEGASSVNLPSDVRSMDKIKKKAFKGSDYDENIARDIEPSKWSNILETLMNALLWIFSKIAGIIPLVIFALIGKKFLNERKKNIASNIKEIDMEKGYWTREIPLKGKIDQVHYMYNMKSYGFSSVINLDFISAYILKWIKNGNITPIIADKSKNNELVIEKIPSVFESSLERTTWKILEDVAVNNKITNDKMSKYFKRNDTSIKEAVDESKEKTKSNLSEIGIIKYDDKGETFAFTEEGKEQYKNTFGFKQYLKDFTIINEREAREVTLWDSYLILASVYGIADEVEKQFEKLVPNFMFAQDNSNLSSSVPVYQYVMLANSFNRSASSGYSAAQQARRSSGGGGFSSSGGGGGSSGGGSGGGSR